jgi:hypothetical protein
MAPEAFFDCLQIASELSSPLNGVTRMDFQRIAFLSCLLSVYQAKPVADWGYRFANTGNGTPYSDQLSDAVMRLLASGHLVEGGTRLSITPSGQAMLRGLRNLDSNAGRSACLDAACSSMLAVPLATMADGIEQEPTISASHLRSGATMLLEEPHLQILHDHFKVLAQVVSPAEGDLFSPSVLWLSYMSQSKVSERAAPAQAAAEAQQ